MRKANECDIVITGAGLVSCLGVGVESTWRAMLNGGCGIGPSTAMQSVPDPDLGYGQADDIPDHFMPGYPSEVRALRLAIDEALQQAGVINADGGWRVAPERCGLVMGTTLHGMRAAGPYFREDNQAALETFLAGSTLRLVAEDLPIAGQSLTTCAACASGLMSIALGISMLASGELDLVIAGGYDPVSEYAYGGFNSLRLVATGAQRPFAKTRDGLKLAEGYGVVVLERASDIDASDRQPIGRVLGCAASADAYHLSQPHPEGIGAAQAMRTALEQAGLTPEDINLIAAHATATPGNDRAEAAAISKVFGECLKRVPVTAMKSRLGHTLGGAGTVELILALCALRDRQAPCVANVSADEVEFDGLDVITGASRALAGRHALINSLGFGGSNACAVITDECKKDRQGQTSITAWPARLALGDPNEPVITGIGVVCPGAVGRDAFVELVRAGGCTSLDIDANDLKQQLNARRVRRLSSYVKYTLAAATLAREDASLGDVSSYRGVFGAVLGTTHGSSKFSDDYYRQLVDEGVGSVNPLWFAEGVPNAGTAHLSMSLGLRGPCESLIGTRTAGLDALRIAATRISLGEWDAAIIGGGEEYSDLVANAYRRCGLHTDADAAHPFEAEHGFVSAASAVSLIVERREKAEARGARIYATVSGWSQTVWPTRRVKAGVQRISGILSRLPAINHCITSANGTWLDRVESMALRVAAGQRGGGFEPAVSSMAPSLHESFSATPLLGLAYGLLTKQSPGLSGQALEHVGGLRIAKRDEPLHAFTVLASDYNGSSSAVSLLTHED